MRKGLALPLEATQVGEKTDEKSRFLPLQWVLLLFLVSTAGSDWGGDPGAPTGAILTAEITFRPKQLGLLLPATLGIFMVSGDFSQVGDTQAIYSVSLLQNFRFPRLLQKAGNGGLVPRQNSIRE